MRNTPLCLDKEFALNSVPFQSSTRTTLLVEFTYWVLSNKWIHLQFPSLTGYNSYFALIFALKFSKWFLLSMEAWTMIEYIFFLTLSLIIPFSVHTVSVQIFWTWTCFCSFPKQLLMKFFSRYTSLQICFILTSVN